MDARDIMYILEHKDALTVSYVTHGTYERLPEITCSELFKYCYVRYVYNAEKILDKTYKRLKEDYVSSDDVHKDGRCLKVTDLSYNVAKYIIDTIADKMPAPPLYTPPPPYTP